MSERFSFENVKTMDGDGWLDDYFRLMKAAIEAHRDGRNRDATFLVLMAQTIVQKER